MTTDLREALKLERLEENLFRGHSPDVHAQRIFGGQVVAQALLAAYETVENRLCHSLHCYFIRPGDPAIPIIFEVDRSRDGRSFTTRRVVAIQHGRQIFNFSASFQEPEAGPDHAFPLPPTREPDGLPDMATLDVDPVIGGSEGLRLFRETIDMRYVGDGYPQEGQILPPRQQVWYRLRQPLEADPRWHQVALAFASDLELLSAAMRPHGLVWKTPGLQAASLDHVLWFHRPTDFTQWHLYDTDSPSASGARGLSRGEIYRADGTLVASCAQEGLIRVLK